MWPWDLPTFSGGPVKVNGQLSDRRQEPGFAVPLHTPSVADGKAAV